MFFLRHFPYGDLYKCKNCLSEFVYNESKEIKYDQSFFASYSTDSFYEIQKFKENNFHSLLKNCFSTLEGLKILDIGCAAGFLLNTASVLGASELYGVDVSKWAICKAKKILPEGNYFCGSLSEAIKTGFLKEERFDIVIGTDVIEHIIGPKDFIKDVLRLLKIEGKAVFTTPDTGSLLHKILGYSWFHYQKEHVSFISSKAFGILANELGFKIKKIAPLKKALPLKYVFSILKYHTTGITKTVGSIGMVIIKCLGNIKINCRTSEFLILIEKQ